MHPTAALPHKNSKKPRTRASLLLRQSKLRERRVSADVRRTCMEIDQRRKTHGMKI